MISSTMTLATVCHAHSETQNPVSTLIEDMRSTAAQLTFAKSQLEGLFSVRTAVVQQKLASARANFYGERYHLAAQQLLDLKARKRIESRLLRAEIAELLADTFVKLGFQHAAADASMTSVEETRTGRTLFENRLLKAMRLYGTHIRQSRLDGIWQRYMASNPKPSTMYSQLHYLYGRAVYRAGKLDLAEATFSAVTAQDQFYIKSLYFLGVITLRKGNFKGAEEHFYKAAKEWDRIQKALAVKARRPYLMDHDQSSRVTTVKPEILSDAAQENIAVGASLNLTLARLAMHNGNHQRALHFYRRVPPGTTDSDKARMEYIQVLEHLKEYRWAARSIHARSTTGSITRLQLSLARARLLAKGQLFEESKQAFERAETDVASLRRLVKQVPDKQLELGLGPDKRIWQKLRPETTHLALQLEQAQEILSTLSRIAQSSQLPAVTQSQRVLDRVRKRIRHISVHIDRLDPKQSHTEGERTISVAMLKRSLERLRARLPGLDDLITQYRKRFSITLKRVIAKEEQRLSDLNADLLACKTAFQNAEISFAKRAMRQLDRLESGAVLGQINIAFWKKEAVSEQILEVIKQQKNELELLEPDPPISQFDVLPSHRTVRDDQALRRWARAMGVKQVN
ncbi:MAG: hypothetical protein VYA30_16185 [Myxococcota bacterium]|nr:hypothetical protein [Myxococcota bacterium]